MPTPIRLSDLLESATIDAAAQIFGHTRSIMRVTANDGMICRVEWKRGIDGREFAIEAKIKVNRSMAWRFRMPNGEFGRWRDGPHDPDVRVMDDGTVVVKE